MTEEEKKSLPDHYKEVPPSEGNRWLGKQEKIIKSQPANPIFDTGELVSPPEETNLEDWKSPKPETKEEPTEHKKERMPDIFSEDVNEVREQKQMSNEVAGKVIETLLPGDYKPPRESSDTEKSEKSHIEKFRRIVREEQNRNKGQ